MPRQFVCLQITPHLFQLRGHNTPPVTQNSVNGPPQHPAPAPGVSGCESVVAVRRPRAPSAASKVRARDSRSLCQTPGQ